MRPDRRTSAISLVKGGATQAIRLGEDIVKNPYFSRRALNIVDVMGAAIGISDHSPNAPSGRIWAIGDYTQCLRKGI